MSTGALESEMLLSSLRSLGLLCRRTLFLHEDEERGMLYEFIGVGPYLIIGIIRKRWLEHGIRHRHMLTAS